MSSGRRGRNAAQTAFLLAASLSTLALSGFFASCSVKDQAVPWAGVYAEAKGGEGPGICEMSVDDVGKRGFSFFLKLIQDNGYSREISGKASYRGRAAGYEKDGVTLGFRLEEGQAPAILLEEGGAKILETEGFRTKLRLAPVTAGTFTASETGAAGSTPGPLAADPKGEAFRFGYYLPEGAEEDALPESLTFLFFDRNGMVLKENVMFEGMMAEGGTLGTFSLSEGSIQVRSKDKKTGKAAMSEWKREGEGALVSDSGQRYFFWKSNLEE